MYIARVRGRHYHSTLETIIYRSFDCHVAFTPWLLIPGVTLLFLPMHLRLFHFPPEADLSELAPLVLLLHFLAVEHRLEESRLVPVSSTAQVSGIC